MLPEGAQCPKGIRGVKPAGEMAYGQMLGTRKGSSCFLEEVAFLSIWASLQRGARIKMEWVSMGKKKACELGEIKHMKLWSRQLQGIWMVLGQAVASALGKQELMLSASMTGTGCFSRMPLADVAADPLCIFAFLPQSLTVNWENIILPPPLPLPPQHEVLVHPLASTSQAAPPPAQCHAVPGICPPRARWDSVLSAGNRGVTLAAGEWRVYFLCVFSRLYQGCPKTTLPPWPRAIHVQEGENVADLQMNLEGLCNPLAAEWVRWGNACKQQEVRDALVFMGLSSHKRWLLCQGWVYLVFCLRRGVALLPMMDVSFFSPVPTAFQQHPW